MHPGWFDASGAEYHQSEWDEREVGDSGSLFESVHEYEPEPEESDPPISSSSDSDGDDPSDGEL